MAPWSVLHAPSADGQPHSLIPMRYGAWWAGLCALIVDKWRDKIFRNYSAQRPAGSGVTRGIRGQVLTHAIETSQDLTPFPVMTPFPVTFPVVTMKAQATQHAPVCAREGTAELRARAGVALQPLVRPLSSVWVRSHRADADVVPLADRHYNRQKIGSRQFAPPGRCLVLKTAELDAFWVTSWPFAEYVRHAWAGAWVCSAFRNESGRLSSELIRQAVSATRAQWEPPALGMVTFVDPGKVRRKRDPGRCYRRAGFSQVGTTKGGLVALQLLPCDMPEPLRPMDDNGGQMSFF